MTDSGDSQIRSLGACQIRSPLRSEGLGEDGPHFVHDNQRIRLNDRLDGVPDDEAGLPESLELAGPRETVFFEGSRCGIGIVTCGGLCPGLNDVIRGLVMIAHHRYGVRRIYGFRYGYRGCALGHVMELTPELVSDVHEQGGTILGTSRGEQDSSQIVDTLERLGIQMLFVIGGDGTLRGALAISEELRRRKLAVGVVGVPKTIDNDIGYIDRSFGFETAYSEAVECIDGAHNEARGAPNGVGIVKLMGRHSGFIACHATLATSDVNFALIPEISFNLDGPRGLLAALHQRLNDRHHAVIVAAEGAGQEYVTAGSPGYDASGNVKLGDIGPFLCARVREYFAASKTEVNIRYIDPSYIIRSVPARPPDGVYCFQLAQNAVHAAMCGKTEIVIGRWHGRMVHVPMRLACTRRKQVDPKGDLWLSVLESTGQAARFE